ncbi:hypothetical protein EON63_10965 [archaeon]|nr:MAG: hypothetical protein EON63_10965 [archaeon]
MYMHHTPYIRRPTPFLGEGKSVRHYLNNHIRLVIDYHDDKDFELLNAEDETTTKIVGFRVEAMSIKHSYDGSAEEASETVDKKGGKKAAKGLGGGFVANTTPLSTCNALAPPKHDPKNYLSVDKNSDGVVIFTYDVVWVKSDTEWSQRWDVYLTANSNQEKVSIVDMVASLS